MLFFPFFRQNTSILRRFLYRINHLKQFLCSFFLFTNALLSLPIPSFKYLLKNYCWFHSFLSIKITFEPRFEKTSKIRSKYEDLSIFHSQIKQFFYTVRFKRFFAVYGFSQTGLNIRLNGSIGSVWPPYLKPILAFTT